MSKKLWGGRFKKETDKDFFEFQKSIQYDYKLAEYDFRHSNIHIIALKEAGILDTSEFIALSKAIEKVEKEIKEEIKLGKFKPQDSEDIHSEIQNRTEKKMKGKLALKLHSLRSRNDQVVFDEKWYCQEKAVAIFDALADLCGVLVDAAAKNIQVSFIGYTHTQRAQVIKFTDYFLAFFNMFKRDGARVKAFIDNLSVYIGAGALTGTSLTKKDYNEAIKQFLKNITLIKPVENPLDNVSDRDFIIEFLSILSIIQMHFSRLAEDLILYSTKEFNFIDLPEEFCTGSSLMPHKKNPDFLELVRGNTGKIYGNLVSILTTMKGLPLTYNRDMQLDKEPLFSSVEILEDELKIMAKFLKGIKLNKDVIDKALEDKTLYATELAEWLVRQEGVPFKLAHDIVGKLIIKSEQKGGIEKLEDDDLIKLHPALNKKVISKVMNAKYALLMKKSFSRRIPKIPARILK